MANKDYFLGHLRRSTVRYPVSTGINTRSKAGFAEVTTFYTYPEPTPVPEARFRDRRYASRLRASEGRFRRCLCDGAFAPPSAVPPLHDSRWLVRSLPWVRMERALSNLPLTGLRKRCRERFPWLLPVVRLFLETVFWGFGRLLPCVFLSRRRVGLDGEGLGGGYCTPPNQK